MIDIVIPEDLWDDGQDGVLATWFYGDGEVVETGSVIAEILTEKVAHELTAPAAGALERLVPEDSPIKAGQIVARLS